MAEPATSESSPDTDRDFDPSADMLVHDFDDERTLEEEENLSNEGESVGNELDALEKEREMPLDDLLAMYGYGGRGPESALALHDTRSSSEEEILSNQDLTLDKDEIARDLLKNEDHAKEESVNDVEDLIDSVEMPSQTSRLLPSAERQAGSSEDDSEDIDYEPAPEPIDDWKKSIQVGFAFQAVIPQGLAKYDDKPVNEHEDRLLWDPSKLGDSEVERYLKAVQEQNHAAGQGVSAIPLGAHVRDDEQALYLLQQCGHNVEEALRRRKMQAVPPTDPMSLWSEEECRNFENGLRTYGKDFYLIQQQKVRTRSVGELVQFYYLWKKTERHDMFANKNRLEKRKYALHPGVTDYMDRFLDEQDNPIPPRDRSASPSINSLLYGDPKHHHSRDLKSMPEELQTAHILEMVQKVVGPNAVDFSPIKLNSQLGHHTAANPASVSINPQLNDASQCAENLVYSANFTPLTLTENLSVFPSATLLPTPAQVPAMGELEPSSTEPCAKRLKLDSDAVACRIDNELNTSASTAFANPALNTDRVSTTSVSSASPPNSKRDIANHSDHSLSNTSISVEQSRKNKDTSVSSVLVMENCGSHIGNVGLSLSTVGSTTKYLGDSSTSSISSMNSSTAVSGSASLLPTPQARESLAQ